MNDDVLQGFRRGDREALSRVYREHVDAVERIVRRTLLRLGAFSAANLSDLVQDVFMKAFSAPARARYDGTRAYAPFLNAIAKNVVVDWARRSGREVLEADWQDAALDSVAAGSADDGPYPPEILAVAQSYLEGLSPELRAVHERHFQSAEPQRSAAEALGISRQALRTLEAKLLQGLRRALARAELHASPLEISQPKTELEQ